MSESTIAKFEVIPSKDADRWNEIVKRFKHWDIYYLNEYARSMEIHGDGEAYLIHFLFAGTDGVQEKVSKEFELCYTIMKKDISKDTKFFGMLTTGQWYDVESPYGYGGFLMQGVFSEHARLVFEKKMADYAKKNKIVSEFVRFYPVYRNDIAYSKLIHSRVQYLKDTIYIDTVKMEDIMQQMDSKNRNMVRKAVKSGITIFHDKGEHLDEFIKVYESTMQCNGALAYYFFRHSYYEYIIRNMRDNIIFFYSVYKDHIIGASIFFYNQEFMHYHLSGLYKEYRALAATNLLLYEAAKWANMHGIRLLHLGGGIEAEDSLFGFKKQFNKNGRIPFYVGRTIFDEAAYQHLLTIRKQADHEFDENNNFMIQYRR